MAILIILAAFILWIVALVDVLRRQFNEPNGKIIWLLVVLLAPLIGSIIYLLIGKNQGTIQG